MNVKNLELNHLSALESKDGSVGLKERAVFFSDIDELLSKLPTHVPPPHRVEN